MNDQEETQRGQVVMLVLNDVTHDSRVRKEARSLAGAGLDVLVVGVQPPEAPYSDAETLDGFRVERIRYRPLRGWLAWLPFGLRRLLRHILQYLQAKRHLRRYDATVFHAHDFRELTLLGPVAKRRGAKLVYDSHELFFDRAPAASMQFRASLGRPLMRRIERQWARRADAVLTVSPAIADELAARFGVERPIVVMNAAESRAVHDGTADLRAVITDSSARLIVHTGKLSQTGRNFAEMLEAVSRQRDDVHLVFLGDGPMRQPIERWSVEFAIEDRVHFVSPVPSEAVVPSVASADLALVLMDQRQGLNMTYSLPNKLFEALAAGVPVVASDLPMIAGIVREYDCGVLCDSADPASIAAAIRDAFGATRYPVLKANAQKAASLVTWDNEEAKLVAIYRQLGVL